MSSVDTYFVPPRSRSEDVLRPLFRLFYMILQSRKRLGSIRVLFISMVLYWDIPYFSRFVYDCFYFYHKTGLIYRETIRALTINISHSKIYTIDSGISALLQPTKLESHC